MKELKKQSTLLNHELGVLKTFKIEYWYRYGDYKDFDIETIEADSEEEAINILKNTHKNIFKTKVLQPLKKTAMNNEVFTYQGSGITFQRNEGSVMVNATEMAKSFGKTPKDYLKTQSAQELINALSVRTNILTADIVKVIKGGNIQGTWMHEAIALDFAQWLSVDFKLWCNDRIKELLKIGFTATPQKLEDILSNPDLIIGLASELKKERAEKEVLNNKLELQHPKVLFADAVETSKDSCLISELSRIINQKGIKIGQNRLFAWLRERGYLCTKGEYYNLPSQTAMNLGLFEIKKTVINKPDGTVTTNTTTKVTGKGQIYFVNKFLKQKTFTNEKSHQT